MAWRCAKNESVRHCPRLLADSVIRRIVSSLKLALRVNISPLGAISHEILHGDAPAIPISLTQWVNEIVDSWASRSYDPIKGVEMGSACGQGHHEEAHPGGSRRRFDDIVFREIGKASTRWSSTTVFACSYSQYPPTADRTSQVTRLWSQESGLWR